MKTLIIVDAQNDFMPGGSLPVPDGDKIVPVINRIQDKFNLVVATQDWHPQNHISFASNHPGKSIFEEIEVAGKPQTLWPDHCVQNTDGALFHPDLQTERWEAIFRKGTDSKIDSYSAFYDNGHLKSTGLAGYLKEKGASQLFFCGLAADICVYYSIYDAFKEGFACFFIEDATQALDLEGFKEIKKELIHLGIQFITSEEI
ncbi:bifunctional nicotinamidase/pyrazinamidase [Aequorivita antarctica]|uniref:Nicotinamidase n=1 Tax=Aequorivita antarctica TaxID=153266 RepID=A0A5C6Z2A5_9FLAO|nr:bifunctional nicotinamidase/pyrazinamidase [Aequorivita antarctica]TXD73649.1 bifunctional nicotinamidase/pyrazinamidase [Aequorivita antarctica]SRX75095.1 Nicotinamidase [Aequorivita antarctica]